MSTHKTAHAAAQARYHERRRAGIPPRTYRRQAGDYRTDKVRAAAAMVAELKTAPCKDCGGCWPPVAMDFDHVRGEKVVNIAELVRKGKLAQLIPELDKCDLVCAGCHRVRTQKRIDEERTRLAQISQ